MKKHVDEAGNVIDWPQRALRTIHATDPQKKGIVAT
jgi:hypothetical protein